MKPAESGIGENILLEKIMVRLPGFEPGSSTWQAEVLNQARLQPHNGSESGLLGS